MQNITKEKNIFFCNMYIENVNIDFFIVMYMVLWDMTTCNPLMSTGCCLHHGR